MVYFLGVDVGGTKTHMALADAAGRVLGLVTLGPGNPDSVGYDGLTRTLVQGFGALLRQTRVVPGDIRGGGFGIAGYDWPEDEIHLRAAIRKMGFDAPLTLVNDTVLGIPAGTEEGWGVAVVSGTGCNAWGWDRERRRIGHVTGGGTLMGEGAGASELLARSLQVVAQSWTLRGPRTALADAFVAHVGARDLEDFLAGIMRGRYHMERDMVLLVFQTAHAGDEVALGLVQWAGQELGELANAVIRQVGIRDESFEVVLIGSMFNGSPILQQEMERTVKSFAPRAHFKRLTSPPVLGALLLGMEAGGQPSTPGIRQRLEASLRSFIPSGSTSSFVSR